MIRRKSGLMGRVLVAALFLTLGTVSANAYTIVMRDGRRVEIPNTFTLTPSTLTYEAGSGIQITIQLNTVDVAATERANGESKGAFLQKGTRPQAPVDNVSQTRRAADRSITNADLESYRRARIESERAYERQRKELGLPSLEERRREAAEIQERTLDQVRNMRQQQQREEEAYWRLRADSVRPATFVNQTEVDLMRSGFYQGPSIYSVDAFPAFLPFDGFGFGTAGGRFRRFGRFPSSDPFAGFLTTPITPFPRFPPLFRRPIFTAPGVRVNPRPFRGGSGHRR
jgi:hypothetical protein